MIKDRIWSFQILKGLTISIGGCIELIYLYIYIYMYICISVYLYICISVYLYVYVSIYLYIFISMYLYIYISMYLYIYISLYLYIYINIYIYIHIICTWNTGWFRLKTQHGHTLGFRNFSQFQLIFGMQVTKLDLGQSNLCGWVFPPMGIHVFFVEKIWGRKIEGPQWTTDVAWDRAASGAEHGDFPQWC